MPRPARTSSRTGPTLTAAGRRFSESSRIAARTRTVARRDTRGTLTTVRHIPDSERRARLARRHALAPAHRAADRGGGDPGGDGPALDRAGHRLPLGVGPGRRGDAWPTSTGRSTTTGPLVKQLAMRRTLFVFPRDLLPAAWGSASARVADRRSRPDGQGGRGGRDRRRRRGLARRGQGRGAGRARRAGRADRPGDPAGGARSWRPGSTWRRASRTPPTSRSPRGCSPSSGSRARIVRGANAGHWRISKPALDADGGLAGRRTASRAKADEGYAELVRALAALVRAGHRGRPRLVAGRHQGRGPRRAGLGRRRSRSPSTAAAPAGCCPTTWTRWPRSSRGRRCCRCSTRR